MIDVIADGEAAQARRDAWEHLRAHAAPAAELGADLSPEQRASAVEALRRWYGENAGKLAPDGSGVFRTGP